MAELTNSSARIYVAGHLGLVGSAVVRVLRVAGYENLLYKTRAELDLRDQDSTQAFFAQERPQIVILAAARVGGIMANATRPADFIGDNLAIQTNVLRAAHAVGVDRLLFLGSSCVYPREAPQPIREEYLLTGPLEPTNQWYAIAKIAGIKMCEAYHRQYGSDFISVMPCNLYGPGDNVDLQTSHVLPALLRKFEDARTQNDPVTVWGSGRPLREFLFVDDLADACRLILETPEADFRRIAPDGLLNVGAGEEISIRDLAAMIREVVGSRSEIIYDRSKPDGTYRKLLDLSRIRELGWQRTTPLREGIRITYEWYREALAAGQLHLP